MRTCWLIFRLRHRLNYRNPDFYFPAQPQLTFFSTCDRFSSSSCLNCPLRRHYVSSNALRPAWMLFAAMMEAEQRLQFSLRLMTGGWTRNQIGPSRQWEWELLNQDFANCWIFCTHKNEPPVIEDIFHQKASQSKTGLCSLSMTLLWHIKLL